jgi:hypothetical protein
VSRFNAYADALAHAELHARGAAARPLLQVEVLSTRPQPLRALHMEL